MRTLLRWVLRLYPEGLDGIHRQEMEETFLDGLEETPQPARHAVRELWGLFLGGIVLRVQVWADYAPGLSTGSGLEVGYELRLAIRSLRRSPGFAAAVVATSALGIGATTLVFSFVHGILLAPLPFADPERLVAFNTFEGSSGSVSEPEFLAFRDHAKSLEAVAGAEPFARTLQVNGLPRRITTLAVTHEFFGMLGVPPLQGRTFLEGDDVPDATPVAVLGHALWLEMFGGEPDVVGRALQMDGKTYEVVGVMPAGFTFPPEETALWTAYPLDTVDPDRWNNHHMTAYGRLRSGVPLATARAEIRALGEGMVAEHGEYLAGFGFTADLTPLSERIVGPTRTPLLVLLAAVAFLLLIGCANVASLVLARGESRRHEAALRAAMGASRGRLLVHGLAESLVLASLGGAAGVGLAFAGVHAVRGLVREAVPRAHDVTIDGGVLVFALVATCLTGLLFGLLPAVGAGRVDPQASLAETGRSRSGSRRARATRRTLVAAEVALSVILVVGAGVMLKSVSNLYRSDPGFRTENVLTARVTLPPGHTADPVSFYEELLDGVEALPGVISAGAASRLPLVQPIGMSSIQIAGREMAAVGDAPIAEEEQVTPGYFLTLDLALREGRFLSAADRADGPLVVVVNEAFSQKLFPAEDALGQRIRFFRAGSPWMTVVGVVGDERHASLELPARPKFYLPHAQAAANHRTTERSMNLVVHGDAVEGLAGPIRALVTGMSGEAPVYHVQTMVSVKRAAAADRAYPTFLLATFGVLALLLASMGVYGMVAFDVGQRCHDIGVHVAMGATAPRVQRMFVADGLVPVGVGIAIGLLGAWATTRVLRGLLYGVSPLDPGVFLTTPVVLVLVAALAAFIPARHAASRDAADILRSD